MEGKEGGKNEGKEIEGERGQESGKGERGQHNEKAKQNDSILF